MALAARAVIRADREQPGVFALRAGVRLQAHRVVAGALDQHLLEFRDQLSVARGLIGRRQRMDVRELRPGDRDHLARRIELHRARAQRDHRAVEREVLVGQRAHVAQHLVLAVVRVEHRMRQERRGAAQARRDRGFLRGVDLAIERVDVGRDAEQLPQRLHVGARRGLVERDADDLAGRSPKSRELNSRRLMPAARAAAWILAASTPLTVSVSKYEPLTCRPTRLSPSARIAVSRCTRRAIRARPSGP